MSQSPAAVPPPDGPSGALDLADGRFDPDASCDEPHLPCRPCGLANTPIVVLSSLAPGVDTLAAEAALDYALDHPEVSVRAPLPFPVDVFARSSSFRPEGGSEQEWAENEARFRALVKRIEGQDGFVRERDLFCVEMDAELEAQGDPGSDLEGGTEEAPRTGAFAGLGHATKADLLHAARIAWIRGQLHYAHKKAGENEHKLHFWHHWGWTLATAGALNVVGKFVGAASHAAHYALPEVGFAAWFLERRARWGWAMVLGAGVFGLAHVLAGITTAWPGWNEWWLVLTGVALVAGALCLAWSERSLHGEPADSDEAARTLGEIQSLLVEVGCDALDENAEWLILHRTRPLEPCMAG